MSRAVAPYLVARGSGRIVNQSSGAAYNYRGAGARPDEFTADLPCNQIPKALAGRLAASPLLGDAARALLRQAVRDVGGRVRRAHDPVLEHEVLEPQGLQQRIR